ncbi:YbhB/YbcL family Raf kinase inhibitor-like protein [Methylobacterium sp. NEAU K]|uniref:YbhB/YbcL family Raf kinase inhibitor-like protein n=1 Tax=Methylobacterium sp. NEAU K TaxID=3064946 RepID=UPI002732AE00|nr:YbhB/YbcL family Raf kinase inhibitor-like protein [Methylobacterium sp. NEAU K]MDP4002207.1 YbhB/YbcL family Raf kinase inhibitor-like protein [Methylobacterium sp. NEAU K]
MLEKMPHVVGEALSFLKAGIEKTAYHATFRDVPETLTLTSPAFADGAEIPARFTADGPGTAPPLAWSAPPPGTAALVLLVEDAGSPTPQPLVHLIAWNLPPDAGSVGEGALPSPGRRGDGLDLGKNSFLRAEWLPPDPPTGHGRHDYLFQIYALGRALHLPEGSGRGALLDGMRRNVTGKGSLTGTYARA